MCNSRKVTSDVILNIVTPLNNLLLNLYFENSTIEVHVLYVWAQHVVWGVCLS